MFMVFPHVLHAQRVDHTCNYNIKGVWSHLGDMSTPFLCSVVLHLYRPSLVPSLPA